MAAGDGSFSHAVACTRKRPHAFPVTFLRSIVQWALYLPPKYVLYLAGGGCCATDANRRRDGLGHPLFSLDREFYIDPSPRLRSAHDHDHDHDDIHADGTQHTATQISTCSPTARPWLAVSRSKHRTIRVQDGGLEPSAGGEGADW